MRVLARAIALMLPIIPSLYATRLYGGNSWLQHVAGEQQPDCLPTREIQLLPCGRRGLIPVKPTQDIPVHWLQTIYCSRALEWVSPSTLLKEALDLLCGDEPPFDIQISYSLMPSVRSKLYRPRTVFIGFSVDAMFQGSHRACPCHRAEWEQFRDPKTLEEHLPSHRSGTPHVRTISSTIIKQRYLRDAVSGGMNHIPLLFCSDNVQIEMVAWTLHGFRIILLLIVNFVCITHC